MDYKDLKILYEDNHIIVVVKPAGIPTQADDSNDIDMLSIIKQYLKEKYNKPGNVYLGLLHRLDRMVSGVMVFAKTSKAASRISEYIRQKNVTKKYLAILNGTIKKHEGQHKLVNMLVKDSKNNISKVVEKETRGAKEAILTYKVLKNFEYREKQYTLVDVNLETGRHHQIRAQFSNIGHPLYGDIKYGLDVNKKGHNIALFSYYLSFYHPTKDEYLEFEYYPDNTCNIDKIWSYVNYGNR